MVNSVKNINNKYLLREPKELLDISRVHDRECFGHDFAKVVEDWEEVEDI